MDVGQNLLGRVRVVSHKELEMLRVDVIGARHIVSLLDDWQLLGRTLSIVTNRSLLSRSRLVWHILIAIKHDLLVLKLFWIFERTICVPTLVRVAAAASDSTLTTAASMATDSDPVKVEEMMANIDRTTAKKFVLIKIKATHLCHQLQHFCQSSCLYLALAFSSCHV